MEKSLRTSLLDLHRALIEHERRAYEKAHGRISPADFLQVVTGDPALAWLAPLTALIARLDEVQDGKFAAALAERVQRDPEVAFAYAAAAGALRPAAAPRLVPAAAVLPPSATVH
jgi:hypothetical protein